MTGPSPVSPVDRKLYGDLADDIHLLRTDGRIVARFKAGFRVDASPEILTAAEVRGMAAKVRGRRLTIASTRPPDAPRAKLVNHSVPRETARLDTPPGEREGTPAASRAGSALANVIEQAGKRFAALSPAHQKAELEKQKASFARAEIAIGSDRDEAEYRHRLRAGKPLHDTPSGAPPTADVRDQFWRAVEPSEPSKLQGLTPNAGDGGETAATRGRPSPSLAPMCPCGRPIPHGGRCWHKRGMPPPGKVARSGNIAALWAEIDALKSANARLEAAVSSFRAQIGIGETR